MIGCSALQQCSSNQTTSASGSADLQWNHEPLGPPGTISNNTENRNNFLVIFLTISRFHTVVVADLPEIGPRGPRGMPGPIGPQGSRGSAGIKGMNELM